MIQSQGGNRSNKHFEQLQERKSQAMITSTQLATTIDN